MTTSVETSNADFAPSTDAIREPVAGADNYELTHEIAFGGMGSILEAVDTKLRRTVAAKVMSLDAEEDRRIRDRFLREAAILASLEHPNIVPIHDIVWEQGEPLFYTMKKVKGRSLQAVLDDLDNGDAATVKEFTLDRLLIVFRKVCDAIAFAHSKGILHRDLKPANVMVGEYGEVLVMDWGLARRQGDLETGRQGESELSQSPSPPFSQSAMTLHGSVLGTPAYMPPEQAQGRLEEVDERSDIFALGGILYAMLTLRSPATGSTKPEVLRQAADVATASPATVLLDKQTHLPGGRVPPALTAVVLRAMQPDPAKRYDSVLALGADIEAYQNGFATRAEHASLLRQIWLLIKRHRTATAALVLIAALGLSFIAHVIASGHEARRLAESSRQALAKAQIALADAAYGDQDSLAMLAKLDSVPEDLRGNEWRYLQARADTSQVTLNPEWGVASGVAAHPTQPGVFAVAFVNRVHVVEARTGRLLARIPLTPTQCRTTWYPSTSYSPDGSRLLVAGLSASSVAIYEVSSGKALVEWETADGSNQAEFSHDGHRTLDIGNARGLTVRDAQSGRTLWNIPRPSYEHALFTTSGEIIATKGFTLKLLDGETGTVIKDLANNRAPIYNMVLSPDERTLYTTSGDGYVRGVRLADGGLVFEQRLSGGSSRFHLALNAAGTGLVAALARPTGQRLMRVWDVATGNVLQNLMGGERAVEGLAVHPLSGEVVITGMETKIWALTRRAPRWTATNVPAHMALFLNADDCLLTGSKAMKLKPDGKMVEIAAIPRPAGAGWGAASVCGDLVAVGAYYQVNIATQGSSLTLLRHSATGLSPLFTRSWGHGVGRLRLSRDGLHLAVKDAFRTLEIMDTATGDLLSACELPRRNIYGDFAWLEPNRLLGLSRPDMRGAQDFFSLWNTATGQLMRQVPATARMEHLAVAPDGKTFAEGGPDKRIRIHDAKTLAVLHEFRVHDAAITALAFHPTQPILATGSADLTIRLWNLDNDSLVEELRPGPHEPQSLHFSPTGKHLASVDARSVLRVWEFSE